MLQLEYRCPDRDCDSVIKSDPTLRLMDQMPNIGARIRNHVHYYKRNHDNDPVRPEQSHRISPKKSGDLCRCWGINSQCPSCGGNGIIP